MTKTDTTPIVMLTPQDLSDVIREEMGSSVNVTHESEMPSASQHIPEKLAGKEVVFGLAGICKIFNCKMSRAQKLKNTIIKDTGKATTVSPIFDLLWVFLFVVRSGGIRNKSAP